MNYYKAMSFIIVLAATVAVSFCAIVVVLHALKYIATNL